MNWSAVRIALGSLLLALGVLGLVLPILQGWLLLALGALVLSRDVPAFRRLVHWITQRFPLVGEALERIKTRWQAFVERGRR